MEWIWLAAIAGGIVSFMVVIDLISRFASDGPAQVLEDDAGDDEGEPEESSDDVDGSDEAITDADE